MTGAPENRRPRNGRAFAHMALLAFASGLPLPLSGLTLRQWLTENHVGLALIGLTGSLGLAYTLKLLWSPILDRQPPGFLARFGRRRGWLLPIQLLLAGAIAMLATVDPGHQLWRTLGAAGCISFLSASQDMSIDAWRIETFPMTQQGRALAVYVWCYRIALLASGAGTIAAASRLGWHLAIAICAGAMLALALFTFVTLPHEVPPQASDMPGRFPLAAALGAVRALWSAPAGFLVLSYVVVFKAGEAMANLMLPPFYRSLGFDRNAVALASGPFSIAASIAGYLAGSSVIRRRGLFTALLTTGAMQAVVIGLYLFLARTPGSHLVLLGTASIESFAEGLADAAFLTFLSSLCDKRATATQYAFLSALASIPLRTLGGPSGLAATRLGWSGFFVFCLVASVPALLLLVAAHKRNKTMFSQTA